MSAGSPDRRPRLTVGLGSRVGRTARLTGRVGCSQEYPGRPPGCVKRCTGTPYPPSFQGALVAMGMQCLRVAEGPECTVCYSGSSTTDPEGLGRTATGYCLMREVSRARRTRSGVSPVCSAICDTVRPVAASRTQEMTSRASAMSVADGSCETGICSVLSGFGSCLLEVC